jgi:hypothetical protein
LSLTCQKKFKPRLRGVFKCSLSALFLLLISSE